MGFWTLKNQKIGKKSEFSKKMILHFISSVIDKLSYNVQLAQLVECLVFCSFFVFCSKPSVRGSSLPWARTFFWSFLSFLHFLPKFVVLASNPDQKSYEVTMFTKNCFEEQISSLQYLSNQGSCEKFPSQNKAAQRQDKV